MLTMEGEFRVIARQVRRRSFFSLAWRIAARTLKTLFLGAGILIAINSSGCRSGEDQTKTIVLYGFSIMENVMKEEIIPAFQKYWEETTGQRVRVITSFAGSGTITNQIVFGAPAQVAIVATEMDAFTIKEAGLVTTDWRSFENEGTFAFTIACLVTRKGNPLNIRGFEDIANQGVEVVYPDPTTSGGAQWAILALYGSALNSINAGTGDPDHGAARELVKNVSKNAGSLPESARRALTQFGLGYGDVLLTYEIEAFHDIDSGKQYEIVVPRSTIYIEPKVVIVDMNVGAGEMITVKALVDFLWTEQSRETLARNNFRVLDQGIMEKYAVRYKQVEAPFSVDDLGGWKEATYNIIDRTWRQVQREIN